MTDEQIIELFWARSETAIKETDAKYGTLCRRLSENIVRSPEDAEECVNDSYLRVWNLIPDARPAYYQAFLCRIVKNASLDMIKYYTAKKRGGATACFDELEQMLADRDTPERALDSAALTEAIEAFLLQQDDTDRRVFLRRYWYCEAVKDIAADYGVKESKISNILYKCRERLRKHLEKEGFAI